MFFNAQKATRVCRFFEDVLKHPKQRFSPFFLIPWERQLLRRVFGTVDERGRRMIWRAYLEIGKKNGKSELAAGVALYMLAADDEPAAEVYGAATTKDQAGIVFRTAASMVNASPFLRKELKVIPSTKTIVKRKDPDSFYRAISADGDAQDGINPHCVIVDELHRWKTARHFELLDVLTKGTIAREQPLVFEITTAGSTEDESPLAWREHEYVKGIESGDFSDQHFYGKIYGAPPDADWTKTETWALANPSLETNAHGFLKITTLQSEYDKALNQPQRQAAFKRYHLGIWSSSETEWMPRSVWAQNASDTKPLVERPCYLGLDLSSTTDLTSLVAVFPDPADDGVSYDVLPFFWMAKERVRARELADRVPYSTWVTQGKLEETPGEVIDLRTIKKKIAWCCEVFNVQELAFDPKDANQLAIELGEEQGLKCIPVPQHFTHMSEPTKKVMELALTKSFRHANHPILNWNMTCVRVKSDGADGIRPVKPDRDKSGKRIDGAVALILAIKRAVFFDGGSVYNRRGVLVV